MKKLLVLLVTGILLTGCAAEYTDSSIRQYKQNVQYRVSLGDSKSQVLSILLPLHNDIPATGVGV